MAKSKTTPLSKARSEPEIGEFWDTHSLSDYWDETEALELQVRARPRHRITVDPDVFVQIKEQARINGVMPETLINLWLAERWQRAKVASS